jgi:nitroreductase
MVGQATPVDARLAITSRRDEKRYANERVPAETIERILDAGRLTGSSKNRQPWTFVLIEDAERRSRLAEGVYERDNVRTAAFVVGILVAGKGPTSFDAGRAAQNMLLAAWNEGLASSPNGVADEEVVRRELEAGEDERPAIVLSFGVPQRRRDPERRPADEWSARANRRPLADVVRRLDST